MRRPIRPRLDAVLSGGHRALGMDAIALACLLGLVLGFVGSIPVAGPTSVLVLKSTLQKGNREALEIAGGAALGEAIYALVAFWGLAATLLEVPSLISTARIVGGLSLTLVGVVLVVHRSSAKERTRAAAADRPGRRWMLGFASTLFNPTLLVTWTTAVTAIHGAGLLRVEPLDAIPFALGVAIGVVGWFFLLVRLGQRFRDRLQPEKLARLVRGMGWLLIAIGVAILGRALFQLQARM